MDQFERHERVNIDTSHLIFTANKMIGFYEMQHWPEMGRISARKQTPHKGTNR